MTSNQRLVVAVLLSVVFFIGYTAIFPPEMPLEDPKNNTVELKQETQQTTTSGSTSSTIDENPAGHDISAQDKMAASASSNIVIIKNSDFILKIDTLGRISSKELLQEKFNNKEDGHAQMIPAFGTKPLFVRFLNEDLNKEATTVAYKASASEITLDGTPQKVTLTQKLSSLSVTKEITFYADGHYDVDVSLSKNERYFIYLGQRPKVNETEQMMAAVGAMLYSGDEILTIIEDGDVEGRQSYTNTLIIAAFDQYNATAMYGFPRDTNIIVERDRDDNPVVYFDATQSMKFSGYIGPKEYEVLNAIDPMLTNVIEYGWFTFASKPLFALLLWLHGILVTGVGQLSH